MDTSWMGRYRALIETLVRHRNAYARVMNNTTEVYGELSVSMLEWEVLEYIIEHEKDDASMARISEKLAISPSSFSKLSRGLCEKGLVAKYQMVGNRKNIILKPTEEGLHFYRQRVQILSQTIFKGFFEELEGFSDEDLGHIIAALEHVTPADDAKKTRDEADGRAFIKIE